MFGTNVIFLASQSRIEACCVEMPASFVSLHERSPAVGQRTNMLVFNHAQSNG